MLPPVRPTGGVAGSTHTWHNTATTPACFQQHFCNVGKTDFEASQGPGYLEWCDEHTHQLSGLYTFESKTYLKYNIIYYGPSALARTKKMHGFGARPQTWLGRLVCKPTVQALPSKAKVTTDPGAGAVGGGREGAQSA
jgi:ribosomal protein L34